MKGMIVLLPLLGLTWVFGIMAINKDTMVFQYLFAILNSLQVRKRTLFWFFRMLLKFSLYQGRSKVYFLLLISFCYPHLLSLMLNYIVSFQFLKQL